MEGLWAATEKARLPFVLGHEWGIVKSNCEDDLGDQEVE